MLKLIIDVDMIDGKTIPEGAAKQWANTLIAESLDLNCEEPRTVSVGAEYMITAISLALKTLNAPDEMVEFEHKGKRIACQDHCPQRPTWKDYISEIMVELL